MCEYCIDKNKVEKIMPKYSATVAEPVPYFIKGEISLKADGGITMQAISKEILKEISSDIIKGYTSAKTSNDMFWTLDRMGINDLHDIYVIAFDVENGIESGNIKNCGDWIFCITE